MGAKVRSYIFYLLLYYFSDWHFYYSYVENDFVFPPSGWVDHDQTNLSQIKIIVEDIEKKIKMY